VGLWRCPECGQTFVSPHMPHSCDVVELGAFFEGAPLAARSLFDALLAVVRGFGPVTVNATRSRATFQVRMRFAAVERPRGPALRGHLVLTRPVRGVAVVERVEFLSPSYYLHRFRLEAVGDVATEAFAALLREAYGVGEQRHVHEPGWPRVTEPPDWVVQRV
jgi:hypothetical protein